ncbi:MAG: histidine phosphatase family protein [Anaerolineae bacterium]|jgi:serine/threonine-protein phosphatase PGAM5|nr:histidine phosphatase family protein [Anaerolineae bacterium]
MGRHWLTLVRHGQYDKQFGDGGGLNDTGRLQALATGDTLKPLRVDVILASPLLRAQQTAELIAAVLAEPIPYVTDPRLEECVPSLARRYAEWFTENRPHLTPERVAACSQAVFEFYIETFQALREEDPDRHTLIVSHGNVIRYLLSLALEAGEDAWTNMLVYHCSICRVVIDPDGYPMVMVVNDQAHIAPEFRSEQ